MDNLIKPFLLDEQEKKAMILKLLDEDLTDEYGYPTDTALDIVSLWPQDDVPGWFAFIKDLWHIPTWGWNEGIADEDYDIPLMSVDLYVYEISTAGWSGNESLIHAMQNNVLWHQTWVQSRRGGHYIFEREIDED